MSTGLHSEAYTLAAVLEIVGIKGKLSKLSILVSNNIGGTRISCMIARQDALAHLSGQGYPERLCAEDQFL